MPLIATAYRSEKAMILELHNQLGEPLRLSASRLLVTNEDGTPLLFVLQVEPGHVRISHAGEPNFQRCLQEHGIDRTVIVSRHDISEFRRARA